MNKKIDKQMSACLKRFGTASPEEVKHAKTVERIESVALSVGQVEHTEESLGELCKSFGLAVPRTKGGAVDTNSVIRYIISDETVDSYGDIVRQNFDLDRFSKNPVVLFQHKQQEFPVGALVNIRTESGRTEGDVIFHKMTGASKIAYDLASSGFFRAGSIGFMPLSWNDPQGEEREKLGLGKYGIDFLKSELLEFSLVSVPANKNAVAQNDLYFNDSKELDLLKIEVKEIKELLRAIKGEGLGDLDSNAGEGFEELKQLISECLK